jgi:hypothetical protein
MVDLHVMIITHVRLVPHGSYETYETDVRNVTYAESMADISRVVVQFEAADGSSRRVTLEDFRRHCRPERVEDLLDDLVVLCQDVINGREPEDRGPWLRLARGQR